MGWHTCGRQNLGTDHENQCKSKVQITSWPLICTLFFVCFTWSVLWFCLTIFVRAAKGVDIILERKTKVQIKRHNGKPGYRSSHVFGLVFLICTLVLLVGPGQSCKGRVQIISQKWTTDHWYPTKGGVQISSLERHFFDYELVWESLEVVGSRWELQLRSYAKGNAYD